LPPAPVQKIRIIPRSPSSARWKLHVRFRWQLLRSFGTFKLKPITITPDQFIQKRPILEHWDLCRQIDIEPTGSEQHPLLQEYRESVWRREVLKKEIDWGKEAIPQEVSPAIKKHEEIGLFKLPLIGLSSKEQREKLNEFRQNLKDKISFHNLFLQFHRLNFLMELISKKLELPGADENFWAMLQFTNLFEADPADPEIDSLFEDDPRFLKSGPPSPYEDFDSKIKKSGRDLWEEFKPIYRLFLNNQKRILRVAKKSQESWRDDRPGESIVRVLNHKSHALLQKIFPLKKDPITRNKLLSILGQYGCFSPVGKPTALDELTPGRRMLLREEYLPRSDLETILDLYHQRRTLLTFLGAHFTPDQKLGFTFSHPELENWFHEIDEEIKRQETRLAKMQISSVYK